MTTIGLRRGRGRAKRKEKGEGNVYSFLIF